MKTQTPLHRIAAILSISMLFVSALTANAQQTFVWRGGNAGAWLQPTNWFTNGVTSSVTPTSNSIAQFTNASVTNSVGINIGAAGTNNLGSFLLSGNATMTISNSGTSTSGGAGVGNSNGAVRVFGTVSDGVTNLIVNDSASGHLIITNNANGTSLLQLQLGSSGTINVSNVGGQVTLASRIIQDSGETNGFTKTGAGTLTIAGTNSNLYSGLTTLEAGVLRFNKTAGQDVSGGNILVNAGTLLLANSNQMANASALTNAGGTIDFGGFTDQIGSYVQSSGIFTNGTLTASTYALNGGTIHGNLGTGTINVGGSTTLNGTAAATIINVNTGTLTLGSASRFIGTTPAVTIAGGTLALGGSEAVGSFTISSGTLSGSATLTASSYALQGGNINAVLGAGAITVTSGTTALGSAGRLNSSSTLTVNSGQLTLGGNETVASLAGSGGTLALGGNTITVGGGNTSTTFSGGISGSGGGLTKTGSGVLTLAANTSYTGATTINGGTLVYNGTNTSTAVTVNSGATLAGSGSVGATTISTGGTMNPGTSPGTQTYSSLIWEGGGNYNWQLYDAASVSPGIGYDTFVSTGAFTINATDVNKFNVNLWTLSGIGPDTNGSAINFSGTSSYTWTLGTFGSISGFSADKFSINIDATNGTSGFANSFAGTFSINTNSTSLLLIYTAPEVGDEFDWSGTSGNWSTTSNWTNNAAPPATGAKIYYSGVGGGLSTNNGVATEINGLTFRAGAGAYTVVGDALAISSLGIVNNSTALQTVNLNLALGASQAFDAASGELAFGGTVSLGANTLTVTGDEDTTMSGAISGTGGLVKTGLGVLTLGGANTYSGGTLISAGGLFGTTTSLQGGITNNFLLAFDQSTNGTYAGVITGTGAVVKAGAGTVTFSGANDYEGGTLVDGGTLTGSTSSVPGDVEVGSGATFALSQTTNGTFSGLIEGAGRFVKDGSGDVTLSGANTYSGGTLVSGGTLTGTASSLQGPITNNAAVVFNQASAGTYSGAMSGSGSLTKSGAGSLTLSGANSYNGGTLVSAGTLVGSTTSLQGPITNSATVVMSQTTNGTFAGTMTGAGGLTKAGAGTVTLGNNTSYTGSIDLQAGGLIAANNNSLGSSAVTMTNGSIEAASGVMIGNSFTIGVAGSTNTGGNVFVAGWDFQTTANGGTALVASPNTPKTILANYGDQAGGAAIYLDGSNGSFNFGSDQLSAFGGTGLNATNTFVSPTETMSTTTTGAASLAVINVGGTANDQRIVFTLNMTGLKDLDLSYASQRTSTGFTSQVWSYSTDAVTWTSFFTNSTVATSFAITNAATLSALNNAGNVYIGLTLSGASSGSQNNRLDNIVMNAVEETITPSTGTGTLGISEAGSASFTGGVTVNNTATFTAASGGQATFSGVVSGSGTALSKTGAGTVTLSGSTANTFTGTTTVSAGTLELAKTANTAALAGNVAVNSGAVLLLSSSGNVADTAAVTLSGGTIRRGGNVSEVFGSLNLTQASFLDYGADNAVGTLTFAGTYTPSALLTVQNFLPGSKLQFNNSLTSEQLNNPSFFAFSNGFTTGTEGGYFTITAIPEPSTYLAAAGLLSLMLWPSRKRLIKDAKKILGLTPPMRDRLAAKRA